MAFSFMSTNRLQYRDSAFMFSLPALTFIPSFIPNKNLSFLWLGYDLSSFSLRNSIRQTSNLALCLTSRAGPEWQRMSSSSPDRISTSPSFVLCEHYGSFHSKICGRLDLGLNLKVNGDMNCSGTLGMDPGGTKSPLSMRSM